MAAYIRVEPDGTRSKRSPGFVGRHRHLLALGGALAVVVLVLLVRDIHNPASAFRGSTSQKHSALLNSNSGTPGAYLDPERMELIQSACEEHRAEPPSSDMPLAHMMAVHNGDSIVSLGLLLQEIFDPVDTYIIHVKAGINSARLGPLEAGFAGCANVLFVPDEDRIKAGYGDMTDIQMELSLIKTALKSPVRWEYALMMDGSSWPTMPTDERREWFRQRPKGTSQTFYRKPDGSLSAICPGPKCDRTPSRCVDESDCVEWTLTPGGLPVALGWQWIRLTRALAEWITHSAEAVEWFDWFTNPPHGAPPHQDHPIVAPEEHFFGTLHWASPHRDASDDEDFMYVDWQNSAKCRWWPNPRPRQSPCYLSVLDVGDVVRSGRPFMRKVASGDRAIRRVLPMSQAKPHGVPAWHEEED